MRRRLLVAAMAAAFGVGVALWFASAGPGRPIQQTQRAQPSTAGARAAKPSMASVPLPAPANTPAASAEDNAACGIEPASAALAALPEATNAARDARVSQVTEQTMAAMQRSANPQARAAALALKPLIADLERLGKEFPVAPCEPPNCVPLPQPASAAERGWMARPDAAAQASFDALARLAAATTDPRIYAFAFHACSVHGAQRAGACQLITAAQWARLDPGNAVPWASVAANAQLEGDTAMVGEAMHRVAQASRSHHGWGELSGLVLEHAPADDAALEATYGLLIAVISIEAAWIIPGYQTISPFCKAERMADTNRRETCRQIAEVLAERSDTLLDRSFGASIGKRVGWPVERTDAIRAEFASLSQAAADTGPDPDRPSCSALRRSMAYIRDLVTHGELGAMRRAARAAPSNLGARGGDKPKPEGYADRAN